MTSRRRRPIGLLLFLLLAAALAVPKLISLNGADSSAAVGTRPASAEVSVQAVEVVPTRLEERLRTTGTIRAAEQIDLVSEIAGKVERILFEEGRRVKRGELLLKIDDAEQRAAKTRVEYQLELAEQRERRQKQLLAEGVISQQDYDGVLSEVNVLEAERELLEARQQKSEIRAPFSGIIGLRYVSVGSYLTPATLIATLQAVDRVKLDFSVPEKYAAIVAPGAEVAFTVKSSDRPFRGRIVAIEPEIDSETRSLLVRAECVNSDGLLWPGGFADVELVVRQVDDALAVPSLAVLPELGGKKVFVVEDGRAQPRPVETGIRTDDRVEILRGLESGERVIVSGLQQLKTGTEVRVVPGPAAEPDATSALESP